MTIAHRQHAPFGGHDIFQLDGLRCRPALKLIPLGHGLVLVPEPFNLLQPALDVAWQQKQPRLSVATSTILSRAARARGHAHAEAKGRRVPKCSCVRRSCSITAGT